MPSKKKRNTKTSIRLMVGVITEIFLSKKILTIAEIDKLRAYDKKAYAISNDVKKEKK